MSPNRFWAHLLFGTYDFLATKGSGGRMGRSGSHKQQRAECGRRGVDERAFVEIVACHQARLVASLSECAVTRDELLSKVWNCSMMVTRTVDKGSPRFD